jgi:hypothetical protein
MNRYNVSERKNTNFMLMAYKNDVLGVEQLIKKNNQHSS